jgi:predicted nucleic acid-binding protein
MSGTNFSASGRMKFSFRFKCSPNLKAGNAISQPDLWIAAITRAAGGILVTNNSDEFSRVPGLMLEDWLNF